MIRLFRMIRQRLLTDHRFGKYLLYASGEIILIVIGILIALSINNWNEVQKTRNLEQTYLVDLRAEFMQNLNALDLVIGINQKNIDHARELSEFTGPIKPVITDKRFSGVFFNGNLYKPLKISMYIVIIYIVNK
jgi:hypothetical protein